MTGQLIHQVLVEEKLKELGLGHIRSQFYVIEASFTKFVDDVGLVVFEDDQIHAVNLRVLKTGGDS
jgi:hypothetical protein